MPNRTARSQDPTKATWGVSGDESTGVFSAAVGEAFLGGATVGCTGWTSLTDKVGATTVRLVNAEAQRTPTEVLVSHTFTNANGVQLSVANPFAADVVVSRVVERVVSNAAPASAYCVGIGDNNTHNTNTVTGGNVDLGNTKVTAPNASGAVVWPSDKFLNVSRGANNTAGGVVQIRLTCSLL